MTLEEVNETLIQAAADLDRELVMKLVVGTGSCWSCELSVRMHPSRNPRRTMVVESVGQPSAEAAATEALQELVKWLDSATDGKYSKPHPLSLVPA